MSGLIFIYLFVITITECIQLHSLVYDAFYFYINGGPNVGHFSHGRVGQIRKKRESEKLLLLTN